MALAPSMWLVVVQADQPLCFQTDTAVPENPGGTQDSGAG